MLHLVLPTDYSTCKQFVGVDRGRVSPRCDHESTTAGVVAAAVCFGWQLPFGIIDARHYFRCCIWVCVGHFDTFARPWIAFSWESGFQSPVILTPHGRLRLGSDVSSINSV